MPIYTKTGDSGKTSLFNGKKILKSDRQIEIIGLIDELNSFIGIVKIKLKNQNDKKFLENIQNDLYKIMSFLSEAKVDLNFLSGKVTVFEKKIDEMVKKLPKLKHFIIPGENEISTWFHILRAICRRAERSLCQLNNKLIIKYFNRLSDLFFALAYLHSKKTVLKE